MGLDQHNSELHVGDLVCWVPRIGPALHGCCYSRAVSTPASYPAFVVGIITELHEQSIVGLRDIKGVTWDPSVCPGFKFLAVEVSNDKYRACFEDKD